MKMKRMNLTCLGRQFNKTHKNIHMPPDKPEPSAEQQLQDESMDESSENREVNEQMKELSKKAAGLRHKIESLSDEAAKLEFPLYWVVEDKHPDLLKAWGITSEADMASFTNGTCIRLNPDFERTDPDWLVVEKLFKMAISKSGDEVNNAISDVSPKVAQRFWTHISNTPYASSIDIQTHSQNILALPNAKEIWINIARINPDFAIQNISACRGAKWILEIVNEALPRVKNPKGICDLLLNADFRSRLPTEALNLMTKAALTKEALAAADYYQLRDNISFILTIPYGETAINTRINEIMLHNPMMIIEDISLINDLPTKDDLIKKAVKLLNDDNVREIMRQERKKPGSVSKLVIEEIKLTVTAEDLREMERKDYLSEFSRWHGGDEVLFAETALKDILNTKDLCDKCIDWDHPELKKARGESQVAAEQQRMQLPVILARRLFVKDIPVSELNLRTEFEKLTAMQSELRERAIFRGRNVIHSRHESSFGKVATIGVQEGKYLNQAMGYQQNGEGTLEYLPDDQFSKKEILNKWRTQPAPATFFYHGHADSDYLVMHSITAQDIAQVYEDRANNPEYLKALRQDPKNRDILVLFCCHPLELARNVNAILTAKNVPLPVIAGSAEFGYATPTSDPKKEGDNAGFITEVVGVGKAGSVSTLSTIMDNEWNTNSNSFIIVPDAENRPMQITKKESNTSTEEYLA